MTHHLTKFMGDAGFLAKSYSEIRRHNPEGDVLYITGEVTEKSEDRDGLGRVEISQKAVNQDGELSVEANGAVRLPRRS